MGENKKPTQCERVLKYMREFGSITHGQAYLDLGISRLASRIFELREKGYFITSKTVFFVNRYGEKSPCAEYRLEE